MIAMLSCLFVSGIAVADLNPWKDYDVSDAIWSVTTVKVHSKRDLDTWQRDFEGTGPDRRLVDIP
jgi:hypothetical protein